KNLVVWARPSLKDPYKHLAQSNDKVTGPRNLNKHFFMETGSAHVSRCNKKIEIVLFCCGVTEFSVRLEKSDCEEKRKKRGFGRLVEWGQEKYMRKI
ncbi:hypothetical protein Gotri_028060, partial [Gossypium trilobum]|nr:hypothetical protein [Gossypium trilobum]